MVGGLLGRSGSANPVAHVEAAQHAWREHVLDQLLVIISVTAVFGGVWFLGVIVNLPLGIPVAVIGLLAGVLSRVSRSFLPRSAFLLTALFISAALALLKYGFLPIPFLLLAAMAVFATVLLGRRFGLAAVAVAVVLVVSVGALHVSGVVGRQGDWVAQVDDTNALVVIRVAVLFTLALLLLVLTPASLIERAEALALVESKALEALAAEQTERQRLADELTRREVAWQKAQELEALGRLAATAVHDFNNALGVMGPAISLLEAAKLEGELGEIVADLRAATEQAIATTQQLRVLGPVRSQQQPSKLQVGPLVRRAQGALGRVLPNALKLEVDVRRDAQVVVDEGQLLRAITNLVLNARDAMRDGGTITLRVSDAQPGFVAIEVSDTGTGMTDEVKARLFEPYFTTKGEHGTGLGLSSVRDIVTSAGGQLVVDSSLGRGTTISLQLPAV